MTLFLPPPLYPVFALPLPSKSRCAVSPISQIPTTQNAHSPHPLLTATAALAAAATLFLSPDPTFAISGGGKDYATQTWDHSIFHGDYTGKDFSGGLFRACDFTNAILKSASFFKAELTDADMTGVDLSYATIEAARLKNTVLKDAVLVGSYVSDSILEVANIENVDFSDSLIAPTSVVVRLCEREDARGVNSKTGVDTRQSLMCPD